MNHVVIYLEILAIFQLRIINITETSAQVLVTV